MNEICSINVAMQDREELNHNPGCTLKPGRQEVITLSVFKGDGDTWKAKVFLCTLDQS